MFKKKKIKSKSIKNFKENHEAYKKEKKKLNILGKLFSLASIIIVMLVGNSLISNLWVLTNSFDIVTEFEEALKSKIKTVDGKVNILLTWKGGWNHDAPDLTDTIMLASINTKTETVSLFSIPRDFYVQFKDWEEGKINEAYFRGLKRTKRDHDKAMKDLEEKITQITGEEIIYNINVDFSGFTKIIDSIGWITVNIPEDLKDTQYPDSNYGYETFEIKKWVKKLDWTTALKYARSRHSTSDFDRSLRQQIIIQWVKDRIQSLGYLTDATKVKDTYLSLQENIKTNMTAPEIIALALYAKNIKKADIKSFNLNDSCYFDAKKCTMWGFMYYPPREDFKNLSVTLPYGASKTNLENYSEVQKYANLAINHPLIYKENTQLNVFNGTKQWGLAYKYANKLIKYGFNIPPVNSIWNAKDKRYPRTLIYYNNLEEWNETVEALKLFLYAKAIRTETPKFSKDPNTKIEVIIWEDYKSLGL